MASQKLGFLKKITPEMVLAEANKRGGGGGAAAAPAAGGLPADYQPTTEDAFDVIQEFLNQNPSVTEKVGVVYGWKVGEQELSARPQERPRQGHAG